MIVIVIVIMMMIIYYFLFFISKILQPYILLLCLFRDLAGAAKDTIVDIMGICKETNEPVTITTK